MNQLSTDVYTRFFAPVQTDMVESIIKAYEQELEGIKGVVQYMTDNATYIERHLKANDIQILSRGLVNLEKATKQLDADYWRRAMLMTDVYDHLPNEKRKEWDDMISDLKCESFTYETVYATFKQMLADRPKYLAQRVDGLFRNLSGDHVTNSPQGFNKRMIIADMYDNLGYSSYSRSGFLADLRKIIAKIRGIDSDVSNTRTVMDLMRSDTGEWHELDGGAIRMKAFLKGTVHIEINEEFTWQLNQILAFLHPQALSSMATKYKKPKKTVFEMLETPIAPSTLQSLGELNCVGGHKYAFDFRATNKHDAERVLFAIGGVKSRYMRAGMHRGDESFSMECIQFGYDPQSTIRKIIYRGTIPDKISHQFYPTEQEQVVQVNDILEFDEENETLLEPSIGSASLLGLVNNKENVQGFEISEVHAEIARSKGFNVEVCDFLKVEPTIKYDKIALNPPFSEGRAFIHFDHAMKFLKNGGKMVAIVPKSAYNTISKQSYSGYSISYSEGYKNAFTAVQLDTYIITVVKHD